MSRNTMIKQSEVKTPFFNRNFSIKNIQSNPKGNQFNTNIYQNNINVMLPSSNQEMLKQFSSISNMRTGFNPSYLPALNKNNMSISSFGHTNNPMTNLYNQPLGIKQTSAMFQPMSLRHKDSNMNFTQFANLQGTDFNQFLSMDNQKAMFGTGQNFTPVVQDIFQQKQTVQPEAQQQQFMQGVPSMEGISENPGMLQRKISVLNPQNEMLDNRDGLNLRQRLPTITEQPQAGTIQFSSMKSPNPI